MDMQDTDRSRPATSLVHPFFDFWLLGGASVAVWFLMQATGMIRESSTALDQRFLQIGVTFSLLSLVCNYPHFMMSYQMGYARGFKFVRQNWFALIAVPFLLIALFVWAYFSVGSEAAAGKSVDAANALLDFFGIGFRFGLQTNLGSELMGIAVWTMYLTVGWHYSKQVFGCMMVYSRYDGYPLSSLQRNLIKASVFSVALLQFAFLFRVQQTERGLNLSLFPGTQTQLTPLELPEWVYLASIGTTILFSTATLIHVIGTNYRKNGHWPSANFLIPWIAFHVWWMPFLQMPEFTFLMVPFFHSLQYLPFAYRVGTPNFKKNRWYYMKITAHVAVILLIGFVAFEGLPGLLDRAFETNQHERPLFFMTAFAVFINVHHFFIDSVSWKFKDVRLKNAIFRNRVDEPATPIRATNVDTSIVYLQCNRDDSKIS